MADEIVRDIAVENEEFSAAAPPDPALYVHVPAAPL